MSAETSVLVLGIGNTLMGDEGVGPAVIARLESQGPPLPGVTFLDGGTGSLALLEPMHSAERLVLVDAALDGLAPGTIRRIEPRFASDFPPSLSAHDIGLRDLLDCFYLSGRRREVVLYAVSIRFPQPMGLGLSEAVQAAVPRAADLILEELIGVAGLS